MMDTKELIEYFTKCVERADRWKKDAEGRGDWNDVFYYLGQRHQANEAITKLGGKWID